MPGRKLNSRERRRLEEKLKLEGQLKQRILGSLGERGERQSDEENCEKGWGGITP